MSLDGNLRSLELLKPLDHELPWILSRSQGSTTAAAAQGPGAQLRGPPPPRAGPGGPHKEACAASQAPPEVPQSPTKETERNFDLALTRKVPARLLGRL